MLSSPIVTDSKEITLALQEDRVRVPCNGRALACFMTDDAIQTFITRWQRSAGAERANYALFLSELCDLLEVPRPDPTQQEDDDNAYVFERRVVFINPDASQT